MRCIMSTRRRRGVGMSSWGGDRLCGLGLDVMLECICIAFRFRGPYTSSFVSIHTQCSSRIELGLGSFVHVKRRETLERQMMVF